MELENLYAFMFVFAAGIVVSNAGAGGVPVGIAVARQRLQHQETSTSMRNVSLSHHTSHHASYHHFQPDNLSKFTTSGRLYKLLCCSFLETYDILVLLFILLVPKQHGCL